MDDINFHIERIKRCRDELVLRRNHLIDQIEKAFKDVNRDGGISLREARVIDDYGTDKERAQARELDTDTHWSQVDLDELDPGGSCLGFLDAIGYRYYLPTYMTYNLRNAFVEYPETNYINTNATDFMFYGLDPNFYLPESHTEHVRSKFKLFTRDERVCIARLLAFSAEMITDEIDLNHVINPLKNEWVAYLPDEDRMRVESIWPHVFD